jgi:multidrug transporter EmrE-like cation transporter
MPEVIFNRIPNQRFYIVLLFALFISFVEAYAQYSLKLHRITIGILGYICVAIILFNSYNYEALGHMNLVWSCISIVTCFTLGVVFFKEPFNKYTFLAVCFALTAIYLSYLSDEE